MLEKIEGRRRRGPQRMRWLDSIIDSMDLSLSKLQETVEDRGAWCAAAHVLTEPDRTQRPNNNRHHLLYSGCASDVARFGFRNLTRRGEKKKRRDELAGQQLPYKTTVSHLLGKELLPVLRLQNLRYSKSERV